MIIYVQPYPGFQAKTFPVKLSSTNDLLVVTASMKLDNICRSSEIKTLNPVEGGALEAAVGKRIDDGWVPNWVSDGGKVEL